LHDIGLLTLPGGLLNEAAPLTLDEYVLVQSHPRAGAALLSPYEFLSESACLIAHHHERWDGAGYPYGLRGNYIPLSARILSIADVFDAISGRSASFDVALRTLRASSGTQFDPDLLETFCVLLEDHNNRRPFLLRSSMATNTISPKATASPSQPPGRSENLTIGPP
ncbi:MAG: HD domain-containing phosphohydrolase, partial [Nitrospira sp.]